MTILLNLSACLLLCLAGQLQAQGYNPNTNLDREAIGWEFRPNSTDLNDFMISVQVSAEQFLDREPGPVLDEMLAHLPLNNIMLFAGNYIERSEAGRGGSYHQHPEFHEGPDILQRLQAPLAERDLSLTVQIGEMWGYQPFYAPYSPTAQVDAYGRVHRESCIRNPSWVDFQIASTEEMVRANPWIEGLMFMHERKGPLCSLFYSSHYSGRQAYCFCEHCCRAADRRGIDTQRAREGYKALLRIVRSAEAGDAAPPAGWFIAIWRLFMRYPEVLAWDQLWWDGLHDYRARVVGAAKMVKPDLHVGCHFQHASHTTNFLWRAGDDPARIAEYADWLKPSLYMGSSGVRGRKRLERVQEVLFRDVPLDTLRDFMGAIMLHDPNSYPDILADGEVAYGAPWIHDELRRLKAQQSRPIMAGIGIGIPSGIQAETPELIRASIEACFAEDVGGILFSRHYHEMHPELLQAASDVLQRHLGERKSRR